MGSSNNPNPWPSYDSYKDCSLGICSIYCPQYCYLNFPPPPPSSSDDDDDSSGFSPLLIAVIGILASAFLLVSYYMLVTRYCRRRHRDRVVGSDQAADEISAGQSESTPAGLEEALIKAITVYKFKKGEGLVEGSDCSVCLSEFEENESLRLMPKCSHAFHLPCIDTWLKSHSSCPLCRSKIASVVGLLPPPQPSPGAVAPPIASSLTITAHAYRHQAHDALLVICDGSRSDVRHEAVIDLDNADSMPTPKDTDREPSSLIKEHRVQRMRRSALMNSALISPSGCSTSCDAQDFEAEEENVEIAMVAVGTTVRSGTDQIKRSISTEKFM